LRHLLEKDQGGIVARSRNIKPGFYKNEDLAECSIWARFIFPGLWMLADREGRLEDRPKRIKAELLPFDSQDVEPLLAELASRKDEQGIPFIIRYQNSAGRFIQISKFLTHQSPHYSEKKSVIKPPELPEYAVNDAAETPGNKPENSRSDSPIKGGSQPPDSLIPDSLIPDSPKKALALDFALALREQGIQNVNSQHPALQQWEKDGVTVAQVIEAVRISRNDRGKPNPSAAYLTPIIMDMLHAPEKPASQTAQAIAGIAELKTELRRNSQ
jgi:hypothetical protein